jgi:hypothetical protein
MVGRSVDDGAVQCSVDELNECRFAMCNGDEDIEIAWS